MFKPKTFNYRGHRYTIFGIAKTERGAQTIRMKKHGLLHASFKTAVSRLSDGQYAAGERM